MQTLKNLLIVAGAGRNVGKTEFACRLIDRFSRRHPIYGLKVSAIHPDEAVYHGDHANRRFSSRLYVETRYDLEKDTSRMLRAGASKVFYLQGDDEQIRTGFQEFLRMIPRTVPVICESGSLWKYVEPGLLVLVTASHAEIKPRALEAVARADLIVESDGRSGFIQVDAISYSAVAGWSSQQGLPDLE